MADYATTSDLHDLEERLGLKIDTAVGKAVEDLSNVIAGFAAQVDDRFNKVEEDIADLKSDVAELKSDVADLNVKYDRLWIPSMRSSNAWTTWKSTM